jgi:hypothetical protein
MAIVRINKLDAARRQLDAAVRMAFGEEDPVAIHAVVAGAHRIIRDICAKRGDIEGYLHFSDWIAQGHEAEFWPAWNATPNFLKHADSDAESIHELDDETADFLIVITSKWYYELGNSPSDEMRVFAGWWGMVHPNVLKEPVLKSAGVDIPFAQAASAMAKLPRRQQLQAGMLALRKAKGQR